LIGLIGSNVPLGGSVRSSSLPKILDRTRRFVTSGLKLGNCGKDREEYQRGVCKRQ
jgi:selenophosphate synthetase-related protein